MAGLLAHSVGSASTVRLFVAVSLAASTALFLWSQEEQRVRAGRELRPALEGVS